MASPVVWADARARIEAALPDLGVPVAWPNEPFDLPQPPAPFLVVECEGDAADPVELGGGVWEETGTIYVHTMVPIGTGITAGSELRKAVQELFRGLPAGDVVYLGTRFDPLGAPDDDGNYRPLSLAIRYRYQDR